jgi:S-(hydroxymethyl)glutathione dehydrogenase / alcohol dehydrogenase
MKTRAAVARAPKRPLTIVELDLLPPAEGEVLVEIVAAGICKSDLDALSGAGPGVRFPAVFGHEGAGIVRDAGYGTRLRPGEHVIPLFSPTSLLCELGSGSMYDRKSAVTGTKKPVQNGSRNFGRDARAVFHYPGRSTFANYVVFPEIALARIRQDAPLDRVCIAGSVAAGLEAVLSKAKVPPGAKVVVFGLDSVGLSVLQAARMVGAEMIVGVDLNTARRSLGQKFGMSHFINPNTVGSDRVAEAILDLTGSGADFVFECSTVTGLNQAIEFGRRRNMSSALRQEEAVARNYRSVASDIRRVRSFSRMEDSTEVSKIVDWYMEGKINVDDMITATLPFERINDGVNIANESESLSIVVKY